MKLHSIPNLHLQPLPTVYLSYVPLHSLLLTDARHLSQSSCSPTIPRAPDFLRYCRRTAKSLHQLLLASPPSPNPVRCRVTHHATPFARFSQHAPAHLLVSAVRPGNQRQQARPFACHIWGVSPSTASKATRLEHAD
jgi:hypothetical protein